jgi:CBS domain containing-hemolysin-like protein
VDKDFDTTYDERYWPDEPEQYDEDEEDLVKKLNATEFAVDAAMKLDDLNDQIGLNLESEDYDSIGGFVIGLLDHLPEEGEEVVYENLRLVVEKVERNRIETIHIYQMSEEELKERTEQVEAEIEE